MDPLIEIRGHFTGTLRALTAASEDNEMLRAAAEACEVLNAAFAQGKRLYIAGNGGSAADAQHFAAELVGWYKKDQKALPAVALTTDTSFLTAWGNDDVFENIFARQLRAHGREGDVLCALSTSGNSKNILRALEEAHALKMKTIGLLGNGGGEARGLVQIPIVIPSRLTSHIQEAHIALIHALCECLAR